MTTFTKLLNDDAGFIVSAELVLISTIAVLGLVVGLSIWWKKLSPDGRNANEVTSQALTDLGNSATFYDCLVEVERT